LRCRFSGTAKGEFGGFTLKQKLAVLFIIFSMILSMAGCGAAEETTLSGMV